MVRVYELIKYFPALLIGCFIQNCVVPENNYQEPIEMTRVGADTVPPYGEITFAFSRPLDDQVPCFEFFPPFSSYFCRISDSRDSVFISLSGKLDGATHYIIKPCQDFLYSLNQYTADSVTVYTYDSEHEPNDNDKLADTIVGKTVYGKISRSDDQDCFVVRDTTVKSFFLYPFSGAQCTASVQGADGENGLLIAGKERNLYLIPVEMKKPITIIVKPMLLSSDGYYQIKIN